MSHYPSNHCCDREASVTNIVNMGHHTIVNMAHHTIVITGHHTIVGMAHYPIVNKGEDSSPIV